MSRVKEICAETSLYTRQREERLQCQGTPNLRLIHQTLPPSGLQLQPQPLTRQQPIWGTFFPRRVIIKKALAGLLRRTRLLDQFRSLRKEERCGRRHSNVVKMAEVVILAARGCGEGTAVFLVVIIRGCR